MNPERKTGLVAGAGISLWILLARQLGLHGDHLALDGGTSLLLLAALFWLLHGKRATQPDGRLDLKSGLSIGLSSSFITALIVYGFVLLYSRSINPGWLDLELEWKVARMRTQGLPETSIRQAITFARQANTPLGLVGTTLIGLPLLGTFFSLVITFFLRTPGHQYPQP